MLPIWHFQEKATNSKYKRRWRERHYFCRVLVRNKDVMIVTKLEWFLLLSYNRAPRACLCILCVFTCLVSHSGGLWKPRQAQKGTKISCSAHAMFNFSMLIALSDTHECLMKCTRCIWAARPLFLNFIDQPLFPCESPLLSESCMCKLVVSSRHDWKTVSTCVRMKKHRFGCSLLSSCPRAVFCFQRWLLKCFTSQRFTWRQIPDCHFVHVKYVNTLLYLVS